MQALNAARHDYSVEQHIAAVVVVQRGGGLSPEDGTLTRTMKVSFNPPLISFKPKLKHVLMSLFWMNGHELVDGNSLHVRPLECLVSPATAVVWRERRFAQLPFTSLQDLMCCRDV
jgi:hypothetical protein